MVNKQELARKIWESANKMRSKIEANDYKDYILGFIFYKYLSDQEEAFVRKEGMDDTQMRTYLREEDDEGYISYLQEKLGYFISYDHLFSTWISAGSDFEIAQVHDALSAFSRLISKTHQRVFAGIFDTLQTGLSKLGDSASSQTKAVRDLLYLIKDIPTGGQDYDVLGFIYEYLISNFAANAGKKAGEFYTPHEVSVLMSEIVADHLRDHNEIDIYDPTSGSGSLLLNIGQSVARHISGKNKIKYYAQELKFNTYNLTRMNLVMRGIKPDNIKTRNADTLEDDWPYFDESDPAGTYEPLYVDAVVSNPPYSQAWDPSGKENDPRYASFGLAPKSKADYAFLLHDLYHLKPEGIMTIVLPHGVLFRGGEEGTIRKNLIENNHIDAVIGLPANIFFGTGIPTIIMVLKQKRANTDVLIVDASRGFVKDGKNNKLRASDIKRIVDAVTHRSDIDKFSRVVSRSEIRANDYNLNIPRYVDSSDPADSWDLYASMFGGIPASDIAKYEDFWAALPGLKDALFTLGEHGEYRVRDGIDIARTIREHPAVEEFYQGFARRFSNFEDYLRAALIEDISQVQTASMEDDLTCEIFSRLEGAALIDKYHAYQLLHDQWTRISQDVEIIQSETIAAVRAVDPHMVLKKKNGKEAELQDGWSGRILPFELVQQHMLNTPMAELENIQSAIASCSADVQDIFDSLSEEDKEAEEVKECLNADATAFSPSDIAKAVKKLMQERKASADSFWEEDSWQELVIRAHAILEEKKKLDRKAKQRFTELHMHTKEIIESLSDADADELLAAKWIDPLISGLRDLPSTAIADLSSAIIQLAKKYELTFADLDSQIHATERELVTMLKDLTGTPTDMLAMSELIDMLGGK